MPGVLPMRRQWFRPGMSKQDLQSMHRNLLADLRAMEKRRQAGKAGPAGREQQELAVAVTELERLIREYDS